MLGERYFLTGTGTVVFADGSTDEPEFDDIDETFTDEIGACEPDFGLSVNQRTDDVDTDDYADNLTAKHRQQVRVTRR